MENRQFKAYHQCVCADLQEHLNPSGTLAHYICVTASLRAVYIRGRGPFLLLIHPSLMVHLGWKLPDKTKDVVLVSVT